MESPRLGSTSSPEGITDEETVPDEEWSFESFIEIDQHTFGIQLPDKVYGG